MNLYTSYSVIYTCIVNTITPYVCTCVNTCDGSCECMHVHTLCWPTLIHPYWSSLHVCTVLIVRGKNVDTVIGKYHIYIYIYILVSTENLLDVCRWFKTSSFYPLHKTSYYSTLNFLFACLPAWNYKAAINVYLYFKWRMWMAIILDLYGHVCVLRSMRSNNLFFLIATLCTLLYGIEVGYIICAKLWNSGQMQFVLFMNVVLNKKVSSFW